jgi:hypothetical protein
VIAAFRRLGASHAERRHLFGAIEIVGGDGVAHDLVALLGEDALRRRSRRLGRSTDQRRGLPCRRVDVVFRVEQAERTAADGRIAKRIRQLECLAQRREAHADIVAGPLSEIENGLRMAVQLLGARLRVRGFDLVAKHHEIGGDDFVVGNRLALRFLRAGRLRPDGDVRFLPADELGKVAGERNA